MLSLTIDENKTAVTNCSTRECWQFETTEFFGIIYAWLEKDFQGLTQDKLAANIITHVEKGARGEKEENQITVFGRLELGESYYELQSLISDKQVFNDGRYSITISLKDVEEMRLNNKMTASYLPVSIIEERGMSFTNLKSQVEVLIAVLFYYAFHGYKLTQCRHCGRWFATKTLKTDYCSRKSPFPGYERYTCKEAVKAVKDMLEKKRISEYERLRQKADEYGKLSSHYTTFTDFCLTCNEYKEKLKQGAAVGLLQEYKEYLFDSANVRPKYGRLKNW